MAKTLVAWQVYRKVYLLIPSDFHVSYQILLINMWLGRLRPPTEMGIRTNDLRRRLQPEAPVRLYSLQFV